MQAKLNPRELAEEARKSRILTMQMLGAIGSGHAGGSMSIMDALTWLYFHRMNIDPNNPGWPDRDRLVLSKGHAGPALYATLARRGFFPEKECLTLNQPGTNLPSHCDMRKTVGIDMTAGSLGQGLSAAVGMALAGLLDDKTYTVYCIIGDGESQEGQIWEALMFAGHWKLANLVVFIDYNKMQIDGTVEEVNAVEPLADKFRSFNFLVQSADGHDFQAMDDALEAAKQRKTGPNMIILNTIKGKDVGFIEGQVGSHFIQVPKDKLESALAGLNGMGGLN